MNRADRLFHLHGLLRTARYPVAFDTLRDKLEVSAATLKRDIRYLRDHMEAPILYDRRYNGYRYDPNAPEFELPGIWFNDTELYALLAMEQLLDAVQPGLLGNSIGPLKTKVRKLLGEGGQKADLVASRVCLQPMAVRRTNDAVFGQLSGAVFNERPLTIAYHGRERDEPSTRVIHPYRLVHYRDNWYVIAWCERARNLRTFALDRIRKARPADTAFRTSDPRTLRHHIGASFGIFTGSARDWAVLRFTPERARWVADETWHPDQIGRWEGGAYELQVPYSDPRELAMDILKYGPDVEVIAPEDLRGLIAERLRAAATLYRTL
ncbi:Transcriptional regulator [Thioalkalivibrio nitratireducens DSM 14787]|uniref:Transcriptional regulator n=1 Tax=Thioalkalivibrio nitratireducens (strain DSM 14787 / UNIQEM 213 / ALEN2) TaxID=1255043 RepID=L0DZT0_THIND|nr:YafY family protein [Thioalkalivibrio nitratireducens]AGA34460.1 Transcriptional regulator [Thioalkalivibrio nitratireducens DSM 14787]